MRPSSACVVFKRTVNLHNLQLADQFRMAFHKRLHGGGCGGLADGFRHINREKSDESIKPSTV